jgi:hypothetical protein
MLASTALSAGQGYMANRAAEQQQKRMDEQAAQDKLIQSFSPGAQPTPVAAQQGPGVGQQMLADPLTQKLLSQLVGKGIGALTNRPPTVGLGGGGGVQNVASPFNYMTP